MKEKSIKIYSAAILYSFIIGLSFLFVKVALKTTDPLNILAHRFTVSFIVLSIPILLKYIKINLTREDIVSILPLSIFYPTLFFAFQSFGLVYISSSEAGIIQATIPIFTIILATIFLKEKASLVQKISLALSVIGVIYIFVSKGVSFNSNNFIGIILVVISALSSACYNILARKKTKDYRVIDLTYAMIFVGFISFNTLSLTQRIINGNINSYFSPFSEPSFLISIFYLGILSSIVTSFLSTYVLSKIEASKMSVFNNLGTLITMIAGVIFLNENIYYYHIIGTVLIILGVIGTNLKLEKKNNKNLDE